MERGKNFMAMFQSSFHAGQAIDRALNIKAKTYGFSYQVTTRTIGDRIDVTLNNGCRSKDYHVFYQDVRTQKDVNEKLKIIIDDFFGGDTPKNVRFLPEIEKVIYNGPATIVIWSDGTKTIVKCCEDDTFDPEKGLAMAISKKALGDLKDIKKWASTYEEAPKLTFKIDPFGFQTIDPETLQSAIKRLSKKFGRGLLP